MSDIPADTLAALESGSPDEALAAAIRQFDCQAGTIHILEDGMLRLAAHSAIPDAVVGLIQTVPIGKGIAGLAAERREPISLCNLQTDSSGQARPAARATGMEGSLAVPMIYQDQLVGVLGVAKAAAHDWSDAEKAALLRIGEIVASRYHY
jgi:GAF domain-containing protein